MNKKIKQAIKCTLSKLFWFPSIQKNHNYLAEKDNDETPIKVTICVADQAKYNLLNDFIKKEIRKKKIEKIYNKNKK